MGALTSTTTSTSCWIKGWIIKQQGTFGRQKHKGSCSIYSFTYYFWKKLLEISCREKKHSWVVLTNPDSESGECGHLLWSRLNYHTSFMLRLTCLSLCMLYCLAEMICIEQNLFTTLLILYTSITTSSTWRYSYVNDIQSNVKNHLYTQDFIVRVNQV